MKLFDTINSGGIYVIAEMSANHAGKLETALDIVRAAKKAGADCLKVQTYTPDTLTLDCDNDYFRIKGGLWDGYRLYDLYKEAAMPWEWQKDIKEECDGCGLDFLSTPFDQTAVDFLEKLGASFYKIASFELVDIPLIEYAAGKKKPMIISCGMASPEEIQDALDACYRQGNREVVLLNCCSEYPANYADMNLATISDMAQRFHVPIGLSDHSMGHLAAVVAVSLGAQVIEKHFCLSRSIKNPDSEFSMEPLEFLDMVSALHDAVKIKGNVTYELTENEKASTAFRRSLFAIADIKPGESFTNDNIASKRPNYGAPPKYYNQLLGKPARKSYRKGEPIELSEVR
jgi:pseudaminic acid synthase